MERTNEDGQVLPLALGAGLALIATALALVAIAGAVTGKGRAQRAADLAAISAARSMRDDLFDLLSPARLPSGAPNPRHLAKAAYLRRARSAALDAAEANGVAAAHLRVAFPDEGSFPPLRVKAVVIGELEAGRGRAKVRAAAVAGAGASASPGAAGRKAATATGGGYSGPLVYRQGHGMRPDVAAAFDSMSATATR